MIDLTSTIEQKVDVIKKLISFDSIFRPKVIFEKNIHNRATLQYLVIRCGSGNAVEGQTPGFCITRHISPY